MRVLVAGDWHSELHEEVVSHALTTLGHEVYEFKWFHYFQVTNGCTIKPLNLLKKAENKYIFGPTVKKLNADLIETVQCFRPELLFVYRGTHIFATTLQKIKSLLPGCILMGYNNDDPFAPGHASYLWRIFLESVKDYDMVLAYRHANISEYKNIGAKKVDLLRSWFVPLRNHPVDLSEQDKLRFQSDVVFVGHYEDDQRLEYLEEIVQQGIHLRLFGPGYDWDPILKKSQSLKSMVPINLVWGDDYNRALCGAKIALCFFSKLNRDTYTRRCFEIPAAKTLLLSEYSNDLSAIYKEGIDADFFKSKEEMISKIKYYLNDSDQRMCVANSGYHRVYSDGHDVLSRMKQVIQWAQEIRFEMSPA